MQQNNTLDKRLFDYIFEQARDFPLEKAFGHQIENGEWTYKSSTEMIQWIDALSRGLLRLGLRPGDRVGTVVYKTLPEWIALDYALLRLGIIGVPMYPTISPREYQYILQEAEVAYCFVGPGDLYDKVKAAQQNTPSLKEVFTFFEHPEATNWSRLMVPGPDDAELDTEIERISAGIQPDDLATYIYTSGTTGNPKGVVLTHRNVVFNVETMRTLIPIGRGDRGLSFLPVSHIFERAVLYAYTAYGVSVSFTTPDKLGGETGDLQQIKPHFFSAVPRLLEKVYDKIYSKGMDLKGIKRWLFFWAMEMADHWDFDQHPTGWSAFKWKIADKLIFSKWRAALGGSVNGIIVGASACPVRIMRVFNAANIRVREGYGMTEAAPALSFSQFEPGGAMLGTVGQVIQGVEVRIEPTPGFPEGEGEILAKGAGIMQGYYRQPEKTAEVIREINGERWLCAGDIGALVPGPAGKTFLKITDRKKELLKTSGGKYVAPAPIEALYREHRLVDQAMVVGDNFKFVSILLVPSVEGLQEWCHKHEIEWSSLPEMLKHPKVLERYQMLVERINPNFAQFEQVKKFVLVPHSWEPSKSDGTEAELTPSLKLKRRVILQKYEQEIAALYQ